MRIQTKLQFLLLLVLGIFGAGLWQLKYSETKRADLILQDRINEKKLSLERILDLTGLTLKTFANDYSDWDEMAQFVQNGEQAWAIETLDLDTLASFRANALWVYKPDSSLAYSTTNLEIKDLEDLPVPQSALHEIVTHGERSHFFVNSANGPIEVRGSPIYFSSTIKRNKNKNVQGYYFVGVAWNQSYTLYLSKLLESEIIVHPATYQADMEAKQGIKNGFFSFTRSLNGWDGKPMMQIVVRTESPILLQLEKSFDRHFALLIVFASTILFLLYITLWKWITQPLKHISESLRNQNTNALKEIQNDRSEFGDLKKLIQDFFKQKSDLQDEINHRKEMEVSRFRLEEQLRQSQKMEAIGLLAGGVAHDFNNILMAIIGYSDLLRLKLPTKDPLLQDAEQIHKSAQQGASLTRQLLAFSRQQVIEPKVFNLNSVLKDLEYMLPRLIGAHIEVSLQLEPKLGSLKADAGQLEQVMMNLVLNARDAMPLGGKLVIQTSNLTLDREHALDHDEIPSGHYVQLSVTDNGCGMDEETKSRIFDPFFTTKEIGKGTGLGLSTVYGIVKQSGGHIGVTSAPGQGSTFFLCFPRVDEPVRIIPSSGIYNRSSGSETILLVDDNELVRTAIKSILEISGYKVLVARQSAEAIELSNSCQETIHLLITDIVMPQMSGRKLAEFIVLHRPLIKTLFMSGYTGDETITQGTAFLQKPVTMKALLQKIQELLDSNTESRSIAELESLSVTRIQ